MSRSSAPPPELDLRAILEVLNRHQVAYVIVGGVAAGAWARLANVAVPATYDVDVTPETDAPNLDRLSRALDELDARIRTDAVPGGLAFDHDGTSLGRSGMWNLTSPHGDFDLTFVPAGTEGYTDLARRARVVSLGGVDAPLADLADVVRSKETAGREKDLRVLPLLREALRRRDAKRHDEALGETGPESGPTTRPSP
jgi:hypothetical protein